MSSESEPRHLKIGDFIVEVPATGVPFTYQHPNGLRVSIVRQSHDSFNISIRTRYGLTSSWISPQIRGGSYEGIRIDVV